MTSLTVSAGITPTIAEAIGLKNAEGALVAQLEPNSPAAKGGIETGDVVTSVNGETVKDSRDLARRIAAIAPGTSTKLGIFRNGEVKTITITLGKLPRTSAETKAEEQKTSSKTSVLGLTIAPAKAVTGVGSEGVVITEIDPNGPAAESGLQTGDIIVEVAGHAVNTPADVRKILDEAHTHSKRAVLLRVKRDDAMSFVAVPIA
jgi:serine protease Do